MGDLLRGRELDAAVAEEVMGWADVGPRPDLFRSRWVVRRKGIDTKGKLETVPKYHADDNACMGVVRKMVANEWNWTCRFARDNQCYHVEFYRPGVSGGVVRDADFGVANGNAALRAVRKAVSDG